MGAAVMGRVTETDNPGQCHDREACGPEEQWK
jgi:hypothetical protein